MDVLKIEYCTGSMELNLEYWLPAPLDDLRKVLRLLARWGTEEKWDLLAGHISRRIAYAESKVEENKTLMKEYANKALTYPPRSSQCKLWAGRFKEAESAMKNSRILVKRFKRYQEVIEEAKSKGGRW